jgi:protein-disulfide isomerase
MIRACSILLVGLMVAAAPAAASGAAPSTPAAPTDWAARVQATAEGGYRMGNPDAPLKLVEFLSLTCGHCADFASQAMPRVKERVRSGQLSVEYRNYVLNHYDLAAGVLSRCAAPAYYFALTEAYLAEQESWAARIDALTPAQRAQVEVKPTPASVRRTAELLGLKEIAARHGVTPAAANACLADPKRIEQLLVMGGAAEKLGVEGTPTFMLNGTLIGAHNWNSLEPVLGQP